MKSSCTEALWVIPRHSPSQSSFSNLSGPSSIGNSSMALARPIFKSISQIQADWPWLVHIRQTSFNFSPNVNVPKEHLFYWHQGGVRQGPVITDCYSKYSLYPPKKPSKINYPGSIKQSRSWCLQFFTVFHSWTCVLETPLQCKWQIPFLEVCAQNGFSC